MRDEAIEYAEDLSLRIMDMKAEIDRLRARNAEMLATLKAVAIIRHGWPEVFDQVDAVIAKASAL